MTTTSRRLRRIAVPIGLAVAAVGIAVPLTLGSASAADTTGVPTFASLSAEVGDHITPALKQDLREAWSAPDGQRVAALQVVLAGAVDGQYGPSVQAKAKRLKARLERVPDQLRNDVETAVELPEQQRADALRQIKADVLDGAYGEQVQRRARVLQHLAQDRT